MTTAELIALANTKAAAHHGLTDALEYGTTRVLRINGLTTITATGHYGTFKVTVTNTGTVICNGHTVSSTARDLAYGVVNAARNA